MPPVATNAAPSTLADVLRQVVDVFMAVGDATAVEIGESFRNSFGTGSPPRVLFVPHKAGKGGPPLEMGYAYSLEPGCDVLVRGAEDGTDIGRFDSAEQLVQRVGDYLGTACTGRITWGAFEDDSPAGTDAYGADLAVSFTYRYDVRHNAARRALPPATTDTSAAHSPTAPQATPGTEPTAFTATTVAQEP